MSRQVRYLFLSAGWLALTLGVIGAVLPVLPTIPFLILAAFCFSKASPRLHHWLLNQRHFGPLIREWNEKRVIRTRVKAYAISMSVAAGAYSWWKLTERPLFFRAILIGLLAIGIGFILAQKSERR